MAVLVKYHTVAWFVIGVIFGYELAVANRALSVKRSPIHVTPRIYTTENVNAAIGDVASENSARNQIGGGDWKTTGIKTTTNVIRFGDIQMHKDDDTIARALFKTVRVLCWVMTSPGNLHKRASHIRETWGRRCNVLLFVSDEDDPDFPAVGLKVKPGRAHLTSKTMKAFDYVYQHHLNDADWFLKADDDTYVILENLRYLLSAHSPEEAVYFGQHFQKFTKQGYFSGGAGYVLSREALKRFGSRDLNTCVLDAGAEDVQLGRCMDALGVKTGNSRDRLNRSRFHSLKLRDHIQGSYPDWYKKIDYYSNQTGIEAISDYPVSFHYVNAEEMYILEYFTYHAAVYGLLRGLQRLNPDTDKTGNHLR